MFELTFSILRDEGAAEEAAQEAFTRAWRHASACGAGPAWGQRLPVDLSLVHEIRFQAPDGRTALTATFDAANPWQ